MSIEIRQVERSEGDAVLALWQEAFGRWDTDKEPHPLDRLGRADWCVLIDGQIAALCVDREFDTWLGEERVPTCGIAGVTVAAEHRGRGLLRPLLEHALEAARQRGAQLSTLYPTAMGIYRSCGYEPWAALEYLTVPTPDLARIRGDAAPVRRAVPGDTGALQDVYTTWAQQHRGPLTRDGVSFADADVFADLSGISVAEEDGRITGFVVWERGRGYGAEARLEVRDLIGLTDAATRGLLRVLGSFEATVPTAVIRSSGRHAWRDLLDRDRTGLDSRFVYGALALDPALAPALDPNTPGPTPAILNYF